VRRGEAALDEARGHRLRGLECVTRGLRRVDADQLGVDVARELLLPGQSRLRAGARGKEEKEDGARSMHARSIRSERGAEAENEAGLPCRRVPSATRDPG